MADDRRRYVLKSIAGLSTLGLAGCLGSNSGGNSSGDSGGNSSGDSGGNSSGDSGGNSSGDSGGNSPTNFEFRLGTAQEDTISGTAGLTFQRLTREKQTPISIVTSANSGSQENLRLLAGGQLNSMLSSVFMMTYARKQQPPFAERPVPKNKLPYQGFTASIFHEYFGAVDGSGLETTDDLLDSDAKIWALEATWGPRQLLEGILKTAGYWKQIKDRVVDVAAGDLAGAINEGRIQAFVGVTSAYRSLPSYMQQVDSRNSVHGLKMSGELKKGIRDTPGTKLAEIKPQWKQDFASNKVFSYTVPYNSWFAQSVPRDVVYELTKLIHKNGGFVANTAPTNINTNNVEQFTNLSELHPIHPGVADYLKELDVWNENWKTPQ